MPLYEYQCLSCEDVTEVIQRMSDPLLSTCEECGGELKKLVSAPAFQFKGSGWYVTDYARKSGGNGKESGPEGSKAKGDSTSDSGDSSKSEKKASSASSKPEAKAPEAKTKSERIASN